MEASRNVRLKTKCSLALQLIDSFTGQAPVSSGLVAELDGVIGKPIKKPDGFLVYTDLPAGEYTFRVQSDFYCPVLMRINAADKKPLFAIPLQPCASYPFGPKSTYIRMAFRDKDNYPVNGVKVTGVCVSENHAKAQMAQEAEKGTQQIVLANIKGKIVEGDYFLISFGGKTRIDDEYCSISEEIDGFRSFKLNEPLNFAYPRGTPILSAVQTYSDEKGEAVIPFRNPPSKSFAVRVSMEWKEYSTVKEVEVKEHESIYLGTLQLGESHNLAD